MPNKNDNQDDQLEPNGEPSSSGPGSESEPKPQDSSQAESSDVELAKLKNEVLYVRAEAENMKKRLLRDQELAIKLANERLVTELLTVMNNFSQAFLHSNQLKEQAPPKEFLAFITGMEMTYRELEHTLTKHGVEFVGKAGEPFNPAFHEAISQEPVEQEFDGSIVRVVSPGCRLHGRLVHPAKVIVGKAS